MIDVAFENRHRTHTQRLVGDEGSAAHLTTGYYGTLFAPVDVAGCCWLLAVSCWLLASIGGLVVRTADYCVYVYVYVHVHVYLAYVHVLRCVCWCRGRVPSVFLPHTGRPFTPRSCPPRAATAGEVDAEGSSKAGS